MASRMPCRVQGLAFERTGWRLGARHGVARNRIGTRPHQVCSPWHTTTMREVVMFVIGIDPHRGSHAAAALEERNRWGRCCRCPPTASNASAC